MNRGGTWARSGGGRRTDLELELEAREASVAGEAVRRVGGGHSGPADVDADDAGDGAARVGSHGWSKGWPGAGLAEALGGCFRVCWNLRGRRLA